MFLALPVCGQKSKNSTTTRQTQQHDTVQCLTNKQCNNNNNAKEDKDKKPGLQAEARERKDSNSIIESVIDALINTVVIGAPRPRVDCASFAGPRVDC